MGMLLPVITTALTVGAGCAACSPVITMFLSSYVVSHSDGVKNGVLTLVSFYLGKIVSISFLCIATSVIGRQFIGTDGYIGGFNLRLAAQIVMSGIGLAMAIKWFIENKKVEKCQGCHECSGKQIKNGFLPVFSAGITYGFTPCAPLLMIVGYSFTLPVFHAGVTGIVFGLASAAIPTLLLLVVISGALSRKLKQELPQYLRWFRLASYVLLMVMPFIVKSY